MTGERWIFREMTEARLGSFPGAQPGVFVPEGPLIAEVSPRVMKIRSQVDRFQHTLANRLGVSVGSYRTRGTENPTLVHHGIIQTAAWHIMEERGGDAVPLPLAELYSLHHKDAVAVTVAIATVLGRRVVLMDNRQRPASLAEHGALEFAPARRGGMARTNPAHWPPRIGEAWRGPRGETVVVKGRDHMRVQVLTRDGDRDWIDARDFELTWHPVTAKTNPNRRETELAARLVRDLGFHAMGDEILAGRAGVVETFKQLIAWRGVPESRKVLLRTALAALERGHGSRAEIAETRRAAFAALAEEKARAAAHPANRVKVSPAKGRQANPRRLTEDERALLNHWTRWGSDGYPINKLKSGWAWGPWRSVQGPPTVFKTKRAATASFERFIDVLIDASGELAGERARAEQAARRSSNPKGRKTGQATLLALVKGSRFQAARAAADHGIPAAFSRESRVSGQAETWLEIGAQFGPDVARWFAEPMESGGRAPVGTLLYYKDRAAANPSLKAGAVVDRVSFSKAEVIAFKSRWPASGLPSTAIVIALLRDNGDVVEVWPKQAELEGYASGALEALISDARQRQRAGRTSNPSGPMWYVVRFTTGAGSAVGAWTNQAEAESWARSYTRSDKGWTIEASATKPGPYEINWAANSPHHANPKQRIKSNPSRSAAARHRRQFPKFRKLRRAAARAHQTGGRAGPDAPRLRYYIRHQLQRGIRRGLPHGRAPNPNGPQGQGRVVLNRGYGRAWVIARQVKGGPITVHAERAGFEPTAFTVRTIAGARAFADVYLNPKGSLAAALEAANLADYGAGRSPNPRRRDFGTTALFDRFSFVMPRGAIEALSGQGTKDADVEHWAGRVVRPADVTPERLAAELKESGAWDASELADDDQNWRRILWIAANNIAEEEKSSNPRPRANPARPNPRAVLQPGEAVTVPYTGRSRRIISERGTVLGLVPEGVHVQVRHGKTAETHVFPEGQVRRAPRRGNRAAIDRVATRKARIELKTLRQRHSEAVAATERARSEYDCAEAKAKAAQPYAAEEPSAEYRRLRSLMRRAQVELDAQGRIAGELERADPAYVDPFALAPTGTANPRARGICPRAAKTFRMWHEFEPSRVTRMTGPDRVIPGTLVQIGELHSLVYKSPKYTGRQTLYEHTTKRPRPVLATDPDGQSVHIVGGKMRVTPDGLVN